MDAGNQRILGYFIEEAKEHLETLEKGILDLGGTVKDEERVNEMFRAAHSVKGGAAMLGYSSIQRTAHKLEDAFKILSENEIHVEQRLEGLFLKGFDVLQSLVGRLQSPEGLSDEDGNQLVSSSESTFMELRDALGVAAGDEQVALSQATTSDGTQSLTLQVKVGLREMLALFKQPDSADSRQQIQKLCKGLAPLAPRQQGWQQLVEAASNAIANPSYSYRMLAPVVIKELKIASDLLELNRGDEVAPSEGLRKLSEAELPQVLITVDPQEAARVLLQAFNPQQVAQLRQLLGATS
ncbi:MAG: Hpt domain-containing protein [Cyanobacteria bacterium P01_H01_bin.15]